MEETGLIFTKAVFEDLDILVRTRIEVLTAANQLPEDTDMSKIEEESRSYYKQSLQDGSHVAYLSYVNGKFVACGGISFYQVMPTYHNPTGKGAYIMNMYTRPPYRNKGIAGYILGLLVTEAKSRGVIKITLEATAMGRPLYEAYGFTMMQNEMELVYS